MTKQRKKNRFVNINSLLENYSLTLPIDPIIEFNIKNYEYLKQLQIIVDKIKSIVSNPRTHLIASKEARNIETAIRIDSSGLKETAQRGKYWSQKGNEIVPEEVFTDVFDTDLAIYENRFIVTLINKLHRFINSELRHLYSYVDSISNSYQTKIVNYYSLKDINRNSLLNKSNNPDLYLTIEKMMMMRKNLVYVMSSRFYKTLKQIKSLNEADIHPTNILTGDSMYSPCYNFYLKFKKFANSRKRFNIVNKIDFNNYVSYCLLKEFNSLNFKFKAKRLKLVKDEIKLTKFFISNDNFNIVINKKASHIDLIIKLSIKNKRFRAVEDINLKTLNKVSLDLIKNIPDESYVEKIDTIISRRLKKNYTNAFVIAPYASFDNEDLVICNPYVKKLDANLSNMIKSLLLISEGDEIIYSRLCPICGNPTFTEEENGNYKCPNCESIYSISPLKSRNKINIVWIKRIKSNL